MTLSTELSQGLKPVDLGVSWKPLSIKLFRKIFGHKQGRKIDRHLTGRTGIWRTRRVFSFVTWSSRSRKIERHSLNRPCRPTLSMTASSMVVIANSISFCSSRSKNRPDCIKFDAAIVKSIKISRSHSPKSAPNQMRRFFQSE